MNRVNMLQRLVIVTGMIMCWPHKAIPENDPFGFARSEKIFPGRPASEMQPKSDDKGLFSGNMYQPGLDAKHGNWWTGNVDKHGNPLPTHEEIAQAKFSNKFREAGRDGGRNEGLLSLLRRQKQVRNAKQALLTCKGLKAEQKASTFPFDTKTSGTLRNSADLLNVRTVKAVEEKNIKNSKKATVHDNDKK